MNLRYLTENVLMVHSSFHTEPAVKRVRQRSAIQIPSVEPERTDPSQRMAVAVRGQSELVFSKSAFASVLLETTGDHYMIQMLKNFRQSRQQHRADAQYESLFVDAMIRYFIRNEEYVDIVASADHPLPDGLLRAVEVINLVEHARRGRGLIGGGAASREQHRTLNEEALFESVMSMHYMRDLPLETPILRALCLTDGGGRAAAIIRRHASLKQRLFANQAALDTRITRLTDELMKANGAEARCLKQWEASTNEREN